MKTIHETIDEELQLGQNHEANQTPVFDQVVEGIGAVVKRMFPATAVPVEAADLEFLLGWARKELLSSFDISSRERFNAIAAKYGEVEE